MDSLEFNSNQCVLIETPQEFDEIYKFLRSAKNGISLTDFIKLNFYPKFPIYLENAGNTIGYRSTPFCTWTGKQLQILRLNKPTLPNDVTRCSNDTCKERLNCKRFVAEKPNELYWESKFEEINCDFKIEV